MLLEDMGGEVLVSVGDIPTTGVVAPVLSDVAQLIRRFERGLIDVVTWGLRGVSLGSWLEIGGAPVAYRARAGVFARVFSAMPGYVERRERI